MERPTASAVVLAAGASMRMASRMNKVFLPLGNVPILVWPLQLFERAPWVGIVVLVCAEPDLDACQRLVRLLGLNKVRGVVPGGATRHESELCGIRALESDIQAGTTDVLLVHDAVRPFVRLAQVERVIAEARRSGAAILAVPPGDPILTVSSEGMVVGANPGLLVAQTPQAFNASLLLDAHQRAAETGFIGEDTSSVVARAGHPVKIVSGSPSNIKIMTSDDLVKAEVIAAHVDWTASGPVFDETIDV